MKIIIEKNEIMPALKECKKIVPAKTTMPIYSHVAISTDGKSMTMTCNDGRRTVSTIIESSGDECKITLEFDKLFKSVNSFKSGTIEIETDGKQTTIKQGRSKLKIETFKYESFPMPAYDDCNPIHINSEELKTVAKKCGYAMAVNDARPMLNGLHLETGHAVATDGHRLAFSEISTLSMPDGLIIPWDSVASIPDVEGDVFCSSQQLIVKSANLIFSTSLVAAKFPDWRKVVPTNKHQTLTIQKTEFIDALNQVLIGSDSAILSYSNGNLEIKNDQAEATIESSSDKEDGFESGFFIQYLIDALKVVDDELIKIEYFGVNKPIIINTNHIVMPRRI